MKLVGISIVFLMLMLSGCGDTDTVVAEIGDIKIEQDDFAKLLKTRFNTTDLSSVSYDDKIGVLQQLLDQYREVFAAQELKLHETPDYIAERKQNLNRFLANALYNKRIINALVPEATIRQYYDWQQIRIEAVVIKTGYKDARVFSKPRSKEEALALSEAHKAQLAASTTPQETASQLTDDKRNKSFLQPYLISRFSWKVDAAVYGAKVGETVGPVETEFGYCVVRIIDRKPEPSGTTLEADREKIQETLMARRRGKEEKALFKKVTEELSGQHHVRYHDDAIETFAKGLTEWGSNTELGLSDFPDKLRQIELGRIGNDTYHGQFMLDYFKNTLKRDYKKFSTAARLKELFLIPQFNLLTWAYAAKQENLQNSKEIDRQLDNFRRNRLSQLFEKKAVDETIQITNKMVEEHYNANPERYTVADRIRIWKISVEDQQIANEIAKKAKSGVGFNQLARSYEHQGRKKTSQFNMGFQTRKSRHKEIVDKAMEMGPNQIAGPFFIDGYHSVIRTGDYAEAVLQPFEKIKSTVRSELINSHREQRTKAVMEEIRIKYVHKINESILRSLS